jgi:YfiH family protein
MSLRSARLAYMALVEAELGSALVLLTSTPGVAFTTRVGGVSKGPYDSLNLTYATGDRPESVRENRRRISHALGISSDWAAPRQIHGSDVFVANRESPRRRPVADAVVTAEPALPAVVLTADCAAIALVGEESVGAVHVGWRGLCSQLITDAVAAARRGGKTVAAWIGPTIGPCHYEVGPEVIERFAAAHPGSPQFVSYFDGLAKFDLVGAARWMLESAGAVVEAGEVPCTVCDPRFYSYRRDGVTGRQALIVWREEAVRA